MQCSPTHVFSSGDKITFETREIPFEEQVASRSNSGRPFDVKTFGMLKDGRPYPVTYIVNSATFCEPSNVPNRSATMRICSTTPSANHIPFRYQRLMVEPKDIHVGCHPRDVCVTEGSESYTHIPWFLDTTTMAVRRDYDGAVTHYISKIFLYDTSKQSVIRSFTCPKRGYDVIAHCPCDKCMAWFNEYLASRPKPSKPTTTTVTPE